MVDYKQVSISLPTIAAESIFDQWRGPLPFSTFLRYLAYKRHTDGGVSLAGITHAIGLDKDNELEKMRKFYEKEERVQREKEERRAVKINV